MKSNDFDDENKVPNDNKFELGYWAGVCDLIMYTFVFFAVYFICKGFK